MTLREMIMANFCFKCLFKRRCCRKGLKHKDDREQIIDKANKMLNKKPDVLELFKSSQLSQIYLAASLTPEQQLLLCYQRKKVVKVDNNDESSFTSSDEDEVNH